MNYGGLDYTGYTLQSTTDLASPAWTPVDSESVVVNGRNTVSNAISGHQQFFPVEPVSKAGLNGLSFEPR